jgi:hypothetical protein
MLVGRMFCLLNDFQEGDALMRENGCELVARLLIACSLWSGKHGGRQMIWVISDEAERIDHREKGSTDFYSSL